jgi:hypothetical protein
MQAHGFEYIVHTTKSDNTTKARSFRKKASAAEPKLEACRGHVMLWSTSIGLGLTFTNPCFNQ